MDATEGMRNIFARMNTGRGRKMDSADFDWEELGVLKDRMLQMADSRNHIIKSIPATIYGIPLTVLPKNHSNKNV